MNQPNKLDIRIPFASLLLLYVLLGLFWWGFARSPAQAALTVAVTTILDFILNTWMRKRKAAFPWSGFITGLGLCLLLNFGSHAWLPVLPAFLAIASKHVFTTNGKHVFNPTLFGLIMGGMLSGGLISPAPAYQWHGSGALAFVLAALACFIFVFRIGRSPLILSFLGFYTLQMLLRAYLMRHHVPPEAIILGTITSPPFFLFTFYMLTDPATSPKGLKAQVALAATVTVIDFIFNLRQSYSTLFPSLFLIQCALLIWGWIQQLRERKLQFAGWSRKAAFLLPAAIGLTFAYSSPRSKSDANGLTLTPVPGPPGELSDVLEEVDPRLRHIAKWVLSVGDAAAVADFDNDGFVDLFLTQPLKQADDRCVLWRNTGDLDFARVETPAFQILRDQPEIHGLASTATFADIDNDGDQDLFVGVGFGRSRLFRNQLIEIGSPDFEEIDFPDNHTTCLTAMFVDFDRDADLDLIVGNAMPPYLPDYDEPTKLNVFKLPEPEFEGDRRMFHFMHASWGDAKNGGKNLIYENLGEGRFQQLQADEFGMPQTHWTLALNSGDFNQDGWVDVYAANDFGPDDFYLNREGKSWERIEGRVFGSVGRDTYKGMNCSVADFDRNGWLDIYISNVHAPLQAEGSLLWMFGPESQMRNEAARRGALNSHRFGWGAGVADLDLNGWPDLVQANGMVDDTIDRRFETPRDYWYVNSRLARTGPEIHAYADKWGDIRGYSIWGRERNRVLLNDGGQFHDVAADIGLESKGNSRGAALADFDNDGDADLLLTHQFKEPSLFRNDLPADRTWIGLDLIGDGVRTNRDAANARIEIGDRIAEVPNITGFSAQGDRRVVFGLDESENVDVVIHWRNGVTTEHSNLAPNRYHRLELLSADRLR